MAGTRSHKSPRSVAKRRVKSRKSQNAKRLKTQKRKSRNMKGGGGGVKVYMITKEKSSANPVPEREYQHENFPLLRLPMCYIIRESVMFGKDTIYLLFKDNCSIDEIKEILRVVLGLNRVEEIPTFLLDVIDTNLLEVKFENEDKEFVTTFKSLFIKIHGSAGLKYKYISTKTLSNDETKLEINNIKPERDNELTEPQRDSIKSGNDIISRLSSIFSKTPYMFPLLDEGKKTPLKLTLGKNEGSISRIHKDIIIRHLDVLGKHVFTNEDNQRLQKLFEKQEQSKREKETSDEADRQRVIENNIQRLRNMDNPQQCTEYRYNPSHGTHYVVTVDCKRYNNL